MPFLQKSSISFANPKLHEAYQFSKKISKSLDPIAQAGLTGQPGDESQNVTTRIGQRGHYRDRKIIFSAGTSSIWSVRYRIIKTIMMPGHLLRTGIRLCNQIFFDPVSDGDS
jgi:hypothetical protein